MPSLLRKTIGFAAVVLLGTSFSACTKKAAEYRSIIFASEYPQNAAYKQELVSLRESKRLKPENEKLIDLAIKAASDRLHIPKGLLWCLLFQESRLDHLAGINSTNAASGIGQFSYFSFYEINHHLDRFSRDNVRVFIENLGRDVRPIEARKNDLHSPSSYYFIPTGVLSSAAYLNNRYLHLQSLLKKQNIAYDSELLWLYAAMAYNKGTRTIVSFWNDAQRRGGKELLEKLTTEPAVVFFTMTDKKLHTRAMKRIWHPDLASAYGKELSIHMESLKSCAIQPPRGV